jgi:transposase
MLELFPRAEFDGLVREYGAERHARGFSSWEQFVSMLFCQLGRAQSLREICDGLRSVEGKARHLGIEAPKRSTLAYANQHRGWQMFEALFHSLLGRVTQEVRPHHKFKFKNRLLSMDGTIIDLCARIFDWAHYKQQKGAVKLHLVLDHAGHLPVFCRITEGNVHEIQVARSLELAPGTILVFDRGYVDYEWFRSMSKRKVWFVTRLRDNATYSVEQERPVTTAGIRSDQIISLEKHRNYGFEPVPLRRVVVASDEGDFEIFTNNQKLAASTIAEIYRQRWQIEIFFKAIKQNLRIKTFVGTSSNALKIQIWTALIAILLLKFFQLKARCGWSLSRLVALIRMHLFTYRDLWAWLADPFSVLATPSPPQLTFSFG